MINKIKFLVVLAAGILAAQTALAETKTYTGMGSMDRNVLTMTLGNGQTVFSSTSEGIATISTEPPILLGVRCLGLGLISNEGEVGTDIFCTFQSSQDDVFDVKAFSNMELGAAEIIGGSGKWEGATGAVIFAQMPEVEGGARFSYKMTITTAE